MSAAGLAKIRQRTLHGLDALLQQFGADQRHAPCGLLPQPTDQIGVCHRGQRMAFHAGLVQ